MKPRSICLVLLVCIGCVLPDAALGIPFPYYIERAPPTSSPSNFPSFQPSQPPSATSTQKISSSFLRTENSFLKSKWMIMTIVGAILSFTVLCTLFIMKSKSLPCSVDRDGESQYSDDEEEEDEDDDSDEEEEEDYDSFGLNLDLHENRSTSGDSSYKERRRRRRRYRLGGSRYGSSVASASEASASEASTSLASVSEYSVSSESSYGLESRTSSYSSAY